MTYPDYRVELTDIGLAYEGDDPASLREKVHSIRGYWGFPFHSCAIAIKNNRGDVQKALRELLRAFGPIKGADEITFDGTESGELPLWRRVGATD